MNVYIRALPKTEGGWGGLPMPIAQICWPFLDTQVSLAPTHVSPSVGDTFEFPFYQRFWTITERPQRLVTFETFDQSDEGK